MMDCPYCAPDENCPGREGQPTFLVAMVADGETFAHLDVTPGRSSRVVPLEDER